MAARLRSLACLALFVASSCLLRAPVLDVVALNPDESQYEAVAAHVVHEHASEYDRPETIGGGYSLYRVMTEWFGAYPARPMRVLVLLIDVVSAWLVFLIVAPAAGRLGGLAGGLVFQHWALGFEGFSANREWFAILPLLAALALATRLVDGGGARRFAWCASGVLAGAALWFKVQALGLLIAVPALIVADGVCRRRPREAGARLVAHVIGGLFAGALYALPLLAHDVLGRYAAMVASGWTEYAMGSGADAARPGVFRSLEALFLTLPSRGIVALAYGYALAVALGRWRERQASEPGASRPGEGLRLIALVALALGACWSIRLGGRFFAHYFLFLVPAVGGLFGLLAGRAVSQAGRGGRALVPLVVLGAYLGERLSAWIAAGPLELLRAPGRAPLFVLGLVVLVAVVAWVGLRPRERAWGGVAAVVLLELALLVVPAQLGPRTRSLPHHPAGAFAGLTAHLAAQADADDRLFVWGWLPELYSITRMVPASHHATTQFIVRDFAPRVELGLDRALAEELSAELERTAPAFIVDATARSWTMASGDRPYRYDLQRYADLGLNRLLRERYRVSARLDGCVVYRRIDPREAAP